MHIKEAIHTKLAPQASGTYSQAIKIHNTVFLAGQIPLDPNTMELVSENITAQVEQVFKNLTAVAEAAGGSIDQIVKLTVFLTNLADFPIVNATMTKYFREPYPARSTIQVSALPRGSQVEVEAVLIL